MKRFTPDAYIQVSRFHYGDETYARALMKECDTGGWVRLEDAQEAVRKERLRIAGALSRAPRGYTLARFAAWLRREAQ